MSIAQYGELYDKGVLFYKTLISNERNMLIGESNWPNKLRMQNNLDRKLSNLSSIAEEKSKIVINNSLLNKKLFNKENMNYPLAFPCPGAFNKVNTRI